MQACNIMLSCHKWDSLCLVKVQIITFQNNVSMYRTTRKAKEKNSENVARGWICSILPGCSKFGYFTVNLNRIMKFQRKKYQKDTHDLFVSLLAIIDK